MARSKKSAENLHAITESSEAPNAIALFAGFQDRQSFVLPEGSIVKSLSPLLKPIDFPVGKVLVGKFTKIFLTKPTDEKKGVGIEIIPEGAQVGIALPAVTTIARGLEIDDVNKGEEAESPYLGRTVAIEKLANKIPSKKGQDAWNFVIAILPE